MIPVQKPTPTQSRFNHVFERHNTFGVKNRDISINKSPIKRKKNENKLLAGQFSPPTHIF